MRRWVCVLLGVGVAAAALAMPSIATARRSRAWVPSLTCLSVWELHRNQLCELERVHGDW
jgi:hypothetical protein